MCWNDIESDDKLLFEFHKTFVIYEKINLNVPK